MKVKEQERRGEEEGKKEEESWKTKRRPYTPRRKNEGQT